MIGEFMDIGGLWDSIDEVTDRVIYNYLYIYSLP
jgi:hypothetical protein